MELTLLILKLCLHYFHTTQTLNICNWGKIYKVSDIWRFHWHISSFISLVNLLNKLPKNLKILPQRCCFKSNHWRLFYSTGTILKISFGWWSHTRDSVLQMQLWSMDSCEHPGRVQMHNPGGVCCWSPSNHNSYRVFKAPI